MISAAKVFKSVGTSVHRPRSRRIRGTKMKVSKRKLKFAHKLLNRIDFDVMFRRVRDSLNAKAGWNKWT
jgi:hypothetical protein